MILRVEIHQYLLIKKGHWISETFSGPSLVAAMQALPTVMVVMELKSWCLICSRLKPSDVAEALVTGLGLNACERGLLCILGWENGNI